MHLLQLLPPAESKVAPPGQDFRFIGSLLFRPWSEANQSNASKVGTQARSFDSLDPCGSDPGPNRMHPMNLKSQPQGQDFSAITFILTHSSHSLQRQLQLAWGSAANVLVPL